MEFWKTGFKSISWWIDCEFIFFKTWLLTCALKPVTPSTQKKKVALLDLCPFIPSRNIGYQQILSVLCIDVLWYQSGWLSNTPFWPLHVLSACRHSWSTVQLSSCSWSSPSLSLGILIKDSFNNSPFSFLRLWPVHLYFLSFIFFISRVWFVLAHNSLFDVVLGHLFKRLTK